MVYPQPVLRLAQAPRLELVASAAQVAIAELLSLPAAQLADHIGREMARNPALRVRGSATCAAFDPGEVDRLPAAQQRWEGLLADAAPRLPAEDRWIAANLLADLDGRGRLGRGPQEVAAWLGVPVERVRRVLEAIRAASTPDMAAADLREALLLQIEAHDDAPPALRAIVSGYLTDVAAGRFARIAAALGVELAVVRCAVDFLRTRLSPGNASCGPPAISAPHDVEIQRQPDDRLTVALSPQPVLAIDPLYARLAALPQHHSLSPSEHALIQERVAQARAFLDRLQRRDWTLMRVAGAAVRRQAGFVLRGPSAHLPLTRTEVAQELGLHPSTVSRAVSGKTVLLPRGCCVPFEDFFGGTTSVLDLLAHLISGERSPLSDTQLARLLAQHGFRVARRTVAKYRAELDIPAASAR